MTTIGRATCSGVVNGHAKAREIKAAPREHEGHHPPARGKRTYGTHFVSMMPRLTACRRDAVRELEAAEVLTRVTRI